MATSTHSERNVRVGDDRFSAARRRLEIEAALSPQCAVPGDTEAFALHAGDVALLDVMLRERDPNGGTQPARTALAGLAQVGTLAAAEVLVRAVHDDTANPAVRANALAALGQASPVLGEHLAGHLLRADDALLRQAAGGVLRRSRGDVVDVPVTRSTRARRGRAAKRAPGQDRS
jgi:hypothetical protein